jgi:hypothetical protein
LVISRIAIRCEAMGPFELEDKIAVNSVSSKDTLIHKVIQNKRIVVIEFMLAKRHFVL